MQIGKVSHLLTVTVVSFVCSLGLLAQEVQPAPAVEVALEAPEASKAESVSPIALEQKGWKASAGGEIRIREEIFDNIPVIADPPGVTRGGKNNSIRFRTMLWGKLENNGVTLYGRLNNEFRHWVDDPSKADAFGWPDEILIDNLYLSIVEVFGIEGTTLTVGRQDIALGSRRLVLEGTPKDGSRTIYMNGVTLNAQIDEFTKLDLFGVYNPEEDELAIGHEHRDLVGYRKGNNGMTEAGAGVFLTSRLTEALPFELYYIWKHDTAYVWPAPGVEGLTRVGSADYHTVGTRLLPKFSEELSGELEVAGQFGREDGNDVAAMMAVAGLTWAPQDVVGKPAFSANVVYLTGDDKETTKQEGFNPLWGRYPWVSELYVYSWDAEKAGFWTNLIYPYLQFSCEPLDGHKLRLSAGPLLADERDGPGTSRERGWLGIARWDIPFGKDLALKGDKLDGHLLAEVLKLGDYYNVDHTSYFLRWELMYKF